MVIHSGHDKPRRAVVPDNVLFEGGAGEEVRHNLLEKCRVHPWPSSPRMTARSPKAEKLRLKAV